MQSVKLICLDVDGTMTDGQIYYDSLGNEMKSFNVKDGMAISQAISMGLEFAIITGRNSKIVSKRAEELGIKYVYQSAKNKKKIIEELMEIENLNVNEVLFIGDDINDLISMNYCGYAACPRDACKEVRDVSDLISTYSGGKGAVREIVETVLKSNKMWDFILKDFEYIKQ